jgi:predicted Zn-dependent protease
MDHGDAGLADARQILEAEIRRDTTNYAPLDLEAEVLVRQREAPLAIRLLEEYIRYYRENTAAAVRLAWVMWQQGKREEAIAEVRAALARDPADRRGAIWLARWALEMDDKELALQTAIGLTERHPDEPRGWTLLGRARAIHADETGAREAFNQALARHGGAEPAEAYARFLLEHNHPGEAMRILEPLASQHPAAPAVLVRHAEACFRSNLPKQAFDSLARLVRMPAADDQTIQVEALTVLYREAGARQADDFAMHMVQQGRVCDAFILELIERLGARENRGALRHLFQIISADAVHYSRSMARILSTFAVKFLQREEVEAWLRQHAPLVEQNTMLWGGIGAWLFAQKRWQDTVGHLGRHHGRPDLKPWMLLLLARALEEVDNQAEANIAYREAVQLAPDHTEAALRSRLAYNMAMDRMPAAGLLVAMDCSEQGKKTATIEDLARLCVVESLARMPKLDTLEERKALYDETINSLKSLSRKDPEAEIASVLKGFRQRWLEQSR